MEIIVILLIIAAAVWIECLLFNRFGDEKLTYSAKLEKDEVFEGDEITLTEKLSNGKRLPLPFVKTEIVVPACLDLGSGEQESKEGLCYIPSVFSLKGREQCIRKRQVKCTRRGVFEIGSSSLYGGDLFGLSSFSLPMSRKEKLTVLPTPLLTEDFYPNSRLLYGDIQVRRFICEDPFLISGAHEYTGREPMNTIFWSATARTGKLMALNKDFTTCSRLLILLNFQKRDDIVIAASDSVCELLIKAAAFALDQAVALNSEFALAINIPGQEPVYAGSGEDFRMEQLRRLAGTKLLCESTVSDFIQKQKLDEYTDILLITPLLSEKTAEILKERENLGQGIKVYGTQNQSNSDMFVQIVRKAE